jgi:hypothetical protein
VQNAKICIFSPISTPYRGARGKMATSFFLSGWYDKLPTYPPVNFVDSVNSEECVAESSISDTYIKYIYAKKRTIIYKNK